MVIQYTIPDNWMKYDPIQIANHLVGAKSAVMSLLAVPYQKRWADELQTVQLKREVAGTSRIEGADFTEGEFEAVMNESPEEMFTRSQKQAAASKRAYRWIADLPTDITVNKTLILNIHEIIVRGADDDHCAPGKLRGPDQNVTFGSPKHRGVPGGRDCEKAFDQLCDVIEKGVRGHDPLVVALAAHYHFVAMHPFEDGNGRTARALEALFLQRCGLKDSLFIAMSNYYYEEKTRYLQSLNAVRAGEHDLTPFLEFALNGIEIQCRRLFNEINSHLKRALFRNMMYELFNRLKSKRKRVMVQRQIEILLLLLERDMEFGEIWDRVRPSYSDLKKPVEALTRDLNGLLALKTIHFEKVSRKRTLLRVNLDWPTEISETEFFGDRSNILNDSLQLRELDTIGWSRL
jgi:Fic family protein